ncbi:uncharacterized protein KIAA0513 homolog isoform X4 [Stigmatopora argus]
MDNLIDLNMSSGVTTLNIASDNVQGHSDFLCPEYSSSRFSQQPLLPAPMAPTKTSSHHHHEEEEESDATESADSENDMDPPSTVWELRRSSSSSVHSSENTDAETLERRKFMKTYVEKVFHGRQDLDQEEKAHFGELCIGKNGKGREWFAKYVNAQRCHSKCVSEATFYRLVQSFAVVLFECHQMDDYSPAKNLMTMCFTFYYIGKSWPSPLVLLEQGSGSPAGLDSYLIKANSWISVKKDAAERLLKNSSKTDVKGFFGGLESKLRSSIAPKTEDGENQVDTKTRSPVSAVPEEKVGEKVYLYTHLKQQPIWHTLRFWNAAFFDAVHCEREKRSPTTRGTQDGEKDKRNASPGQPYGGHRRL